MKSWIKKYFANFAFFYGYLRHRIFVALSIGLLIGMLDSFGLIMFLPLLQMANSTGSTPSLDMGHFNFILEAFQHISLQVSLVSILSILMLFFTLKAIVKFLAVRYLVIIQQFFVRKLRIQMLRSISESDYKYFTTTNIGKLLNTTTGETSLIANAYKGYSKALEYAIIVFVYAVFSFLINAPFTILLIIGGAATNLLYRFIYRKTKVESRTFTRKSNEFQGLVSQFLSHYGYLKSTGFIQKYLDKLRETINRIENKRRKIGVYNALLLAAKEPLLLFVVAIVIVIQVKWMGSDLGGLLISLLFFYRALGALIAMQNQWNLFLSLLGSIENAKSFNREMREHRQVNPGKIAIEEIKSGLELRDACFSYGDQPTLSDVNLMIRKNETMAFVGESGSGKTTLINILVGLLKLDQGNFLIDGVDADSIHILSYQKRIGYITQDPVIFTDTVFNNVTLWDDFNAQNVEKFNRAVQKALVFDFVSGLADGMHTTLGTDGINVSGGQKQRISIARELYKDVDILIMDEATSALDGETELAVRQNIDALKGECTVLIIAHRLSTIKNADRIVLLKNGRIQTMGTYPELKTKVKDFRRMVEVQGL